MSKDIAAEIEKEYGSITFKHPIIEFGYNKIEITQKFDIYVRIFLVLSLIPLIGVFFVLDFSFLGFFIAIPFILVFSLFYNYHNYFDKVTIDFLNKELTITNRFWIVNAIRNLIKINTLIPFLDISHFMTDDGKSNYMLPGRSSSFYMRRTSLFVKPKFRSTKLLANFEFERDARRLGELLQYYIVGKPRIIK